MGVVMKTPAVFFIWQSYAAWVSFQIAFRVLLFSLLFECLFLSEHFLDIFKDWVDELRSLTDILFLVLLTAPEVQFALPFAVLASVYLVVLRCRDRSELIAMAGTGVGARQFVALALTWGMVAQSTSLAVTGYVLPTSKFAFRSYLYAFRKEALRSGGTTAHFYSFPGYTFYKMPRANGSEGSGLFIYHTQARGSDRAIFANDASLTGSFRKDALILRSKDIMAFDLPRANAPPDDAAPPAYQAHGDNCTSCALASRAVMQLDYYVQAFNFDQLVRLPPRGVDSGEWSISELLAKSPRPPGGVSDTARRGELTDRLVRSLLCLTAPLIALLAIISTTWLGQALALVTACGVLLCLGVAGLTVAQILNPVGTTMSLLGVTAMFACMNGFVIYWICTWQSALLKPVLSKA